MKSLEVLIFELGGEYGHFRKFNTTSSPLTYVIPTRQAIMGLLGAILGIERESSAGKRSPGTPSLSECFDRSKTKVAVQVLQPIKKVNMGFNLLDTGKSPASFFNIRQRTQIEFELLKNPRYRIYFTHEDSDVFQELCQRIAAVDHHFTPYLGLSQFTASVDWVARETLRQEKSEADFVAVHTAINLSSLAPEETVNFNRLGAYTTDTFPMAMRPDRVVTEYAQVLIERTGQPLILKKRDCWISSFGKILFL